MVLTAAACGSSDSTVEPEELSFPDGFAFGTAVAGFQVDMGCPTLPDAECDDPNSDWYAFITSPDVQESANAHLAGDPPSAGPGHWELYAEDFDLAQKELNTSAFRMSIEWSRIFPTATDDVEGHDALKAIANEAAIKHYHDVFDALAARGLKPLVTLNHYTLPTWIHDAVGCHKDFATCSPRGWVDKDRTVKEIAKYAGFVAKEFGAQVDRWATLNEPFAVLLPGYLLPNAERTNPPALTLKIAEAKTVIVGLIEAHARMYDAVKEGDAADADGDGSASEVGLVYSMVPIAPQDPASPIDVKAAENVFYLYNMAYLNAVVKGDIDEDLDGKAEHRDDLANRMDYLGINYYFRVKVEGTATPFLPELSSLSTFNPLSLQTGDEYPKGIYDMAMVAKKEFGLPSMITENGTPIEADDDTAPSFLVRHLTWVSRAIRDGADIRGYFYWSLLDNYEWNHGMGMRFGLYAVDKDDPTKARVARKVAGVYAGIAKEGAISPELSARFPAPE